MLVLAGVPAVVTACAAGWQRAAPLFTLDVAAERRRCVGEAVQQCLVVRWQGDSTWSNFYGAIDGFTHEDGVRYRLEVERTAVSRPPADASAYRYRLVRIITRALGDSAASVPLADSALEKMP